MSRKGIHTKENLFSPRITRSKSQLKITTTSSLTTFNENVIQSIQSNQTTATADSNGSISSTISINDNKATISINVQEVN